jgi:predicted CXXCH cytochrome family protein
MRLLVVALTAVLTMAACAAPKVTRRPGPAPKAAWVVYPEEEAKAVKNAHDYKGAPLCQRCHASADGKLRVKEPELCYECHKATTMTHVGKLQQPPPKTLPYEEGGRIICHTCHEPHDVKAHKLGFRQEYRPLCLECHKGH